MRPLGSPRRSPASARCRRTARDPADQDSAVEDGEYSRSDAERDGKLRCQRPVPLSDYKERPALIGGAHDGSARFGVLRSLLFAIEALPSSWACETRETGRHVRTVGARACAIDEFLVVGCGPAGGSGRREAARAAPRPSCSSATPSSEPSASAPRGCGRGSARTSTCRARSSTATRRDLALRRRASTTTSRSGRPTRRRAKNWTARSPALARAEGARFARRRSFARLTRDGDRDRRRVRRPRGRRAAQDPWRVTSSSRKAPARGSTPAIAVSRTTRWHEGLITCYQYRVYPERPALPVAYETLEMHYYVGGDRAADRDRLDVSQARSPLDRPRRQRRRSTAPPARGARRVLADGRAAALRGDRYTRARGRQPALRRRCRGRRSRRTASCSSAARPPGLVDATTGEGIHEAAMHRPVRGRRRRARRAGAHARASAPSTSSAPRSAFYGRLHHRSQVDDVPGTQARARSTCCSSSSEGTPRVRRGCCSAIATTHDAGVALSLPSSICILG